MLIAFVGFLLLIAVAFGLSYVLPLGEPTPLPSDSEEDFQISIQESDQIEDPRMMGLSEQLDPVKHAVDKIAGEIEKDMFFGSKPPVSDAELHAKDFPELFKALKKGSYKPSKKRPTRNSAKKKSKRKPKKK